MQQTLLEMDRKMKSKKHQTDIMINEIEKNIKKISNKSEKRQMQKNLSKIIKTISKSIIEEDYEINKTNQKTESLILQNVFIQDMDLIKKVINENEYDTMQNLLNKTNELFEEVLKLHQEIYNQLYE